jgi:hypothetical protein
VQVRVKKYRLNALNSCIYTWHIDNIQRISVKQPYGVVVSQHLEDKCNAAQRRDNNSMISGRFRFS